MQFTPRKDRPRNRSNRQPNQPQQHSIRQSSPATEIIINSEMLEKRIAYLERGNVEAFYLERNTEARLVGNIYKGKVMNVLPGIQAAFVDVGLEKNGFLHASDVSGDPELSHMLDEDGAVELNDDKGSDHGHRGSRHGGPQRQSIDLLLKEGQEIIVQVVKEPISTKGVRLSTHISLPGRFLVLIPNSNLRGVSRKIESREERRRLKDLLAKIRVPNGVGLIVRTVAKGESVKDFERDLRYLMLLWKRIQRKIPMVSGPAIVHEELDLVLKTIRDNLSDEITRVVVDDKDEFKKIRKFVSLACPRMRGKVDMYKHRQPIFDKYGIEKEIEKIFRRKVWLKCGGYLIFDRAEALVAIDVNTGRHMGKDNLEDTVLTANLEACDEIGRQLRLRNMGGIIIIDFIDMLSRRNQREVLHRLKDALRKDKAKTNILPISELGLVEMTRQRTKETTSDMLYDNCPACHSNGMVKSPLSISIEVQRALARIFAEGIYKDIRVQLSSAVYHQANVVDAEMFRRIEKKYRGTVEFVKEEKFNAEEVKYVASKTGDFIRQ
jgi:ribonuclease G